MGSKKTGKKFWANIIVCVVLAGGASLVLANASLTPKGLQILQIKPSAETAALMDKVVLADYRLGAGAEQQVMGEFVVNNTSDKEVKNITVACEFFDKDGKYLDREQWLLSGTIPVGKAMRHVSATRRYVNTSSKSLKCAVTDFTVAKAPFFQLHRVTGGHGGGGHAAAAHAGHDAGHGEAKTEH
jgi:hypothetical protein